jgi:RNA polymerase sigma factor (sigma-70 family)
MEPDRADQFLIEQIRQGSEAAWRQLIARFEGRLLAFARARVAGQADAEDLVQETLVGFVQSLPHYDASRELETYLFTILRYKLCDLFRQRKVTPLHALPDGEDAWDRILPGDTETPSGVAAKAEAQRRQERLLADVLKRLIHEYRDRDAFGDLQIIELLFYAGKRNLEVAELFEMDQKAVAGVKFRAIQRLRKFLDESDTSAGPLVDEEHAEITVARVWRDRRLTCLKRSTLGSYLLGVLDDPWLGYTQFHLDVVGCPLCLANLQDLENEERGAAPALTESILASSIGFLSRASAESHPR